VFKIIIEKEKKKKTEENQKLDKDKMALRQISGNMFSFPALHSKIFLNHRY